jgi:pimeloyl-ACP methyl ester carboxylesterase
VSRLAALSPRRRLLLIGVVAAAAVLAAVVAAAVLPDGRRAVPAPDQPGPVLLVPGYGGGTGGVEALAQRIRATGREATVVVPPGDGTGDLNRQADHLDDEVQRRLRAGAPSVDLIGYSAGGVVVRLWLQNHDGAVKARRIITLGSPHHGAAIAGAGAAAVPGACPTACQQLAPGSRLLRGLATPVPTPPQWLAIWTARDRTVTPPDSARLEGATNVELQAICPDSTVEHGGLPTDPVVTALVLQAIGAGPIGTPTSCVSS